MSKRDIKRGGDGIQLENLLGWIQQMWNAAYQRILQWLQAREEEIVIITNNKTSKRFKIGLFTQVSLVCFLAWSGFASWSFIKYRNLTDEQLERVKEFKNINKFLEKEVNSLYVSLNKLDSYLNIANQYNHFNMAQKNVVTASLDENIQSLRTMASDLSSNKKTSPIEDYDTILQGLRDAGKLMEDTHEKILVRINGLEGIIREGGFSFRNGNIREALDTNKSDTVTVDPVLYIVTKNDEYFVEKPIEPFVRVVAKHETTKPILDFEVLNNNIVYLTELENFVNATPLATPLEMFRITSNFGPRKDPFNRILANHHGLDMAGPLNSEVLSTSMGKVTFSGERRGYGNMVEIDHGYGIITRYGHLKKTLVNKGDIITNGKPIGIQGTTGRSTGPHLHYEIRYHNKPYNPLNFIRAGQELDDGNRLRDI